MDQAEEPEQIQGRPDLELRIKGIIAPGQEKTTSNVNNLLGEVGAALNYLFEQGLEQTRISDTVKKDASEMVNAADQTKNLSTQVSASMNEMKTAVAEIVREINASRADTSAGCRCNGPQWIYAYARQTRPGGCDNERHGVAARRSIRWHNRPGLQKAD